MTQIKCLQDQLEAKTKQAKEIQQQVSWFLYDADIHLISCCTLLIRGKALIPRIQ